MWNKYKHNALTFSFLFLLHDIMSFLPYVTLSFSLHLSHFILLWYGFEQLSKINYDITLRDFLIHFYSQEVFIWFVFNRKVSTPFHFCLSSAIVKGFEHWEILNLKARKILSAADFHDKKILFYFFLKEENSVSLLWKKKRVRKKSGDWKSSSFNWWNMFGTKIAFFFIFFYIFFLFYPVECCHCSLRLQINTTKSFRTAKYYGHENIFPGVLSHYDSKSFSCVSERIFFGKMFEM